MKLRIKRISPLSLALALGGIYFVVGCFAAVVAIFGANAGVNVTLIGPLSFSGSGLGLLGLSLINPFAAFLTGGISGYVIAWIYNFLSRFTKGLVIETEEAGKYDSLF